LNAAEVELSFRLPTQFLETIFRRQPQVVHLIVKAGGTRLADLFSRRHSAGG